MKTGLYFERTVHLRVEQNSYSDDHYELVPFTLSPKDTNLPDDVLRNRIASAVHKKYKPSHRGGCGYSCSLDTVYRETANTGRADMGFVILSHYHGTGD